MLIPPPPYTMDDIDSSEDETENNNKLMTELQQIYNTQLTLINNEINTFLTSRFPTSENLRESAKNLKRELVIFMFQYHNLDPTPMSLFYNNENKTIEQTDKIFTSVGDFGFRQSSDANIIYHTKQISIPYILSYYESICKGLKYSYVKETNSIKIIW